MTDAIDAVMLKQIAEVEQKDEDQVLAELAGEQLDEMVYTVEVYDRKAKSKIRKAKLSWAGVKEVARSRGNIMLEDPIIKDLEKSIRIVVRATDLTRNFTVFGGCQQPLKMKVNDTEPGTGEITGSHLEDDPYCFQKGLSKAQRNALTLCIPADYAAKCITRFLKATGSKTLPQGTRKQSKAPAKSAIKYREDWDQVTENMVPDYPHLEPVIWNLCKLQPADMYRQLGVSSRTELTAPAWESFLVLKELFRPEVKE